MFEDMKYSPLKLIAFINASTQVKSEYPIRNRTVFFYLEHICHGFSSNVF